MNSTDKYDYEYPPDWNDYEKGALLPAEVVIKRQVWALKKDIAQLAIKRYELSSRTNELYKKQREISEDLLRLETEIMATESELEEKISQYEDTIKK